MHDSLPHDSLPLDNLPWALVLAGGDGTRLQDLTRLIAGEPIPKQYCRMLDGRSLLEWTLDRVRAVARPERTLVVVTRDHLRLALPQLSGLPRENVVVQPRNRDTGPGILWSLLEIRDRDPAALVAMFPSDHYVADELAFGGYVQSALGVVGRHPGMLTLLGIQPDEPSGEYGYVLPGSPLEDGHRLAFRVNSFLEKPPAAVAERVVREGGMWNSFVMAYRLDRILALAAERVPQALGALEKARLCEVQLERHYAEATPWNFSAEFLARVPESLAVLRARDTGWSDWGTPASVERTFARLKRVPWWVKGRDVTCDRCA